MEIYYHSTNWYRIKCYEQVDKTNDGTVTSSVNVQIGFYLTIFKIGQCPALQCESIFHCYN